MAKFSNPIAFTRGPVTFLTTLVYAGIIIALIVVKDTLPAVPAKTDIPKGINITEAWLDLQRLSALYHPYNSRSNDLVRDWLLLRMNSILAEQQSTNLSNTTEPRVHIFNDVSSNLTFSSPGSVVGSGANGLSVYFEGTNIIVYIQGSEDGDDHWWKDPEGKPNNDGGVLVNAHYDSVSTGYGATDDGVGVVSILQLIRYYSTLGNTPKKGLVALFNNGEEDFLNGARAFSQHPMSKFTHTFLNLEGAGAGGKAVLFRSTDTEVTRAYKSSPYPFGSVMTGDGFKRGLVRSQTDYVVFNGILGLRGLDVAFFEQRARYHTNQDDARHTSKESLWHMLSAALATTKALTSDASSTFQGESSAKGGVNAGTGSLGVWFDLFGTAFAVFQLHTLFAISVTLLVVAPVFLIVTVIIVYKVDRFYLFSSSRHQHTPDGDEAIPLYGWRGFFRFPFIFAVSCSAPILLGYALFLVNPQIAHSSEWAVWSMMFSSYIVVAWVLCRTADYVRPSALTRAYCFLWMFAAWWAILVANTVFESQLGMAGGYFSLFVFAGIAFATWISLLELFALPKKAETEGFDTSRRPSVSRSNEGEGITTNEEYAEGEEVNEETGLLGNRRTQTFARYNEEHTDDDGAVTADRAGSHEKNEQSWSKSLPTWTWLLQFLLVAPIGTIVVGQLGLLIVGALHQTGQDGSSMLILYMFMATFTILMLSPLVPFLHRFTWHVPLFMLLVLVGTLVYNLIAFPFSPNNRLKLFWQQEVDLDTGINTVIFEGLSPYVENAVRSLPRGEELFPNCVANSPNGRSVCKGTGLPPRVVDPCSNMTSATQYGHWLTFNASRSSSDANKARFTLSGRNTRACKILFDSPISDFHVHGAGPNDKRFPPVSGGGSKEIRLWSRTWDRTWTVDVEWESQDDNSKSSGMEGRVVCMWSDANQEGVIPSLDEARKFLPVWTAVTKLGDGLVEGGKRFVI